LSQVAGKEYTIAEILRSEFVAELVREAIRCTSHSTGCCPDRPTDRRASGSATARPAYRTTSSGTDCGTSDSASKGA
jgi:hypothetical protein